MNDDQLHELFQGMRDDPVPADSLARVRQGVGARIEARRSRVWRVASLGALLAAAAVITVIAWPRPETLAIPDPKVAIAPMASPESLPEVVPPPPPVPAPPVPAPPVPARPKPRRAPVQPPNREPQFISTSAPQSGVVIRIQTPDPEVVILLVN